MRKLIQQIRAFFKSLKNILFISIRQQTSTDFGNLRQMHGGTELAELSLQTHVIIYVSLFQDLSTPLYHIGRGQQTGGWPRDLLTENYRFHTV